MRIIDESIIKTFNNLIKFFKIIPFKEILFKNLIFKFKYKSKIKNLRN